MSTAIDVYGRTPTHSPALKVDHALNHLLFALTRVDTGDEVALARRRAARRQIQAALRAVEVNTRAGFEAILNGCLDVGFRGPSLLAFVFEVLSDRLGARIRRRLYSVGASLDEVSDLVSKTMESIQRLISRANRARHTLRYELLITIGDHRAIDFLRRRRLEYRDDLERLSGATPDPERRYQQAQAARQAARVRDAIFAAHAGLDGISRRALIEVEIHGRGYGEIAECLGLAPSNVGNVVRRARVARTRALAAQLRQLEGLGDVGGYGALVADDHLRRGMLRLAV
ncbi:hypothetical protein KKB55_02195, partial [Myxococcota bacterium]|nr:hypothetical protein [Myxococcota bacterium]